MEDDPWNDLPGRAADLFGVKLSVDDVTALRTYGGLVRSWSARMNLVSATSDSELAHRHILDSLAPAQFLPPGLTVADIGSGAGLPGIPLALIRAERTWLIESRARRVTFLRHALRVLDLPHVEVFEGRAEEFPDAVGAVVGRGVREDVLGECAARIVPPGGRLILMRKSAQPIPDIRGFALGDRRHYVLPGGERHEVTLLERRFT